MSKLQSFKAWWNAEIKTRVKHAAYLGFVILILTVSFQFQVNALSEDRFEKQCEQRIDSRLVLRSIFRDILDLFPDGNETVDEILELIDVRYPPLTEEDCF